jgi:glycosyltransferase involved in cell wall biosynthesis
MPDVGVLALPYHHWGTHWMTPHHVLTRLARYFNVVWIEPAHHWRSSFERFRGDYGLGGAVAEMPPGFRRYVPEPWLPDLHEPAWLRERLLRARVRRGWKHLDGLGCTTRVLHLWHPGFEGALSAGDRRLALYHIDDEYSFRKDAPAVGAQESRVLRAVDQVVAISPGLMERKGGINPHMALVPEGVESKLYMRACDEPPDIRGIPRPRIGYTGVLKRQLDWELLLALARRHGDWSFVYVGPRSLSPELAAIADEMGRLPNVHFLGPKTVTELAAYPQHFDVCTMPYVVDGYTNNIYPLKLHEYLASGRPVVGARIRSLLDFGQVIELATGVDEWSGALERARRSPVESARVRQQVAMQHDWTELIYRIAAIVCERLGPEFSRRLARIDNL